MIIYQNKMKARLWILALAFLCQPLVVYADSVTFTKDVAPIFFSNCATCHRPGQVAPFSVLEYETVRPWAKAISKAVQERRMPPWGADSSKTKFSNDRTLSDQEVEKIQTWVSQGATRGDPEDLPVAPEFSGDWGIGEPDLVLDVEEGFMVPAGESEIPYRNIYFVPGIDEDLYISAWELRPGQPKSVHHANVVFAPKKLDPVGLGAAMLAGGDILGGFLPGSDIYHYPAEKALKIPKDSIIQAAVHYVGLDEPAIDEPRFGVKFARGRVDHLIRTVGTAEWEIEIEPNDPHWEMNSVITINYPITLLSSGAHMHYRGWAYTATAVLPDGTEHLIADVPRYDFNWQLTYALENPIDVPAGTKYSVKAVWNNSKSNPRNPYPDEKAVWGLWTENEMLQTWSQAVITDEKLGLIIENGRYVGRFPDGVDSVHPKMLQSFPNFGRLQKNN